MSVSDLAVLDTNGLVYAADESSEFHEASRVIRDREAITLAITPQILMEFYAIITDARRVISSRSAEETRGELDKYVHSPHIVTLHPSSDGAGIPSFASASRSPAMSLLGHLARVVEGPLRGQSIEGGHMGKIAAFFRRFKDHGISVKTHCFTPW